MLAEYLHTFALGSSREQVRGALQRLSDLGLVLVETVEELPIARLTERGEFVTLGNASYEGVLFADPDCPY